MNWKQLVCLITLTSLIAIVPSGCNKDSESVTAAGQPYSTSEQTTRPEGWTDETHGNEVAPNYKAVFPQDKVNQITITITPDDWEAMQANMTELFGAQGTGQTRGAGDGFLGGFPGMDRQIPDRGNLPQRDGQMPNLGDFPVGGGQLPGTDNDTRDFVFPDTGDVPQGDGMMPGGVARGGLGDMTPENPMWVPATIEFEGNIWTNVGVRYKGNSSLTSGWRSGTLNLPLKLDFDEFEDEYPQIDNQRFYGFKQLSLSNSFSDGTYMRDVISAGILAEVGLPAAKTAYYEVIMDYGEGSVNLGLYVMIEVIDDTVIERVFGDDSGNIYEGEGSGVSLAQGTLDRIQSSFIKENNRQAADWSDIEALYNILHSEERTSVPESWRQSLESIFDVDAFLECLAISAIIEHWDSYGQMSHNFYLYNNPETGRLTWISWDHNMVLGVGAEGGNFGNMRAPAGGGMGRNVSLGREEIGQNWPLIRYLLDDPVYYGRYISYIEKTVNGAFNPEKLEKKCQELAALIAPYAAKESGADTFGSAVQALIDRIYERYQVATDFLAAGDS